MKKFVFIIMLGAFVSVIFGQIAVKQVSISGTVFDDPYPMKRLSMPIQQATVKLWEPLYILLNQAGPIIYPPTNQLIDSAITDAQGKFAFKPTIAGSYIVSADHSSYASRQIDVYATADTSVNIVLVAKGAMASVAGTVWQPCPPYLNCVRQPAAGCTVTVAKDGYLAIPLADALIPAPIFTSSYKAVTDVSGHYLVDSIPLTQNGERVYVTAVKTGYTSQSADTSIWNMMTTTVDITLAQASGGSRDTVYVTPEQPTIKDSIAFRLFNINHDCCTVYRGNAVSAGDTAIYLSYTYDESMVCQCLVAGSWTDFVSAPLSAGKYGIYKAESPYCPAGQICPQVRIAPVRVGEVTVVRASGSNPVNRAAISNAHAGIRITNGMISATVPYAGNVILRAYDVRGALVETLFDGWMAAGSHSFSLARMHTAARVLELSVGGVKQATMQLSVQN
jgi:hypothetical protein